MPTLLDQVAITNLKGVGPAIANKLKKIGILNFQDLLFHLPLRYEDRTQITPISKLRMNASALIEGEVISVDADFGRRRSLLAIIQDDTASIAIRFFHFSRAQQNNLTKVRKIRCFGEVRRGAAGLEMYHPAYSIRPGPLETTLTPIYPATEGLSQPSYRRLVDRVLTLMLQGHLLPNLDYDHPSQGKYDINQVLMLIHKPPPEITPTLLTERKHSAMRYLAFEELLAHHISIRLVRNQMQTLKAPACKPRKELLQKFLKQINFTLTNAQQRALKEIFHDLKQGKPMLRLLQGDVGSGKTVVAAAASLLTIENHQQVAILVPTEILSEQHFLNFLAWFEPLGIAIGWLTSKTTAKKRQEQLAKLKSGVTQLIIGTHALLQKDVCFNRLGLAIIDEQHRFGVHQRLALRQKGERQKYQAQQYDLPHQLVMTATPIPRTLTMSIYADMDCSIIDELPAGRKPITTTVLSDNRRQDVLRRIESACLAGHQAYWVCTLIEESEVLQRQAAEATAVELTETFRQLNVGLIHGRMKTQEKTNMMHAFKVGSIDLLVATTVIEVGVDVPNASLMVIENPERLGLAQLHQLRGRIGRGLKESHCVLLYHSPLGHLSKQRLKVMRETQDGFEIAEQDLEIRGPGEFLGNRQSGAVTFKIADLVRDAYMLRAIHSLATHLLRHKLETAQALMNRWLNDSKHISQV